MIPGSNILNTALRVIAKQSFQYLKYRTRITQSNGQDLSVFEQPLPVKGSAQPVPRNLYQQYGLDFNRSYFNFFLPQGVVDVTRDVSGDQFVLNCVKYQCLSRTPWSRIDGWDSVLCVALQ